MSEVSFRVDKGDRVGLVGRNGAGKTTLTKVIMGGHPANAGSVSVSGTVGYLPQDPRSGDLTATAKERILSARDLDVLVKRLRKAERQMASPDENVAAKAIDRYPRIEAEFVAAGGYAAESEAYAIAANLGLDEDLVNQEIGTLSGGQRRRVELARILFSAPDTMILDEPTNHLDAESVLWLRDYLKAYSADSSSSATTSTSSTKSSTRSSSSMRCARPSTSTRWATASTSNSARTTSAAAAGSARTRRRRPLP